MLINISKILSQFQDLKIFYLKICSNNQMFLCVVLKYIYENFKSVVSMFVINFSKNSEKLRKSLKLKYKPYLKVV